MAYTTASAEYSLPVDVSFTCGKCGREVNASETIFVGTSIGGRNLSTQTAKTLLNTGLPADTQQMVKRIAENWEKGVLMPYDPLSYHSFHQAIQVQCPACRIYQAPNAGGKMTPFRGGKGIVAKIMKIVPFVLILTWVIGFCVILATNELGKEPWGCLYITLGCIAAAVVFELWKKSVRKRAMNDPAYMEKHFDSVLNDAVYADFTPYGLEKIKINSKK